MDVKLYNVLSLMNMDDIHLKFIVEYTLLVCAMNLKGLKIRKNPFNEWKPGEIEYYFTYDIYHLIEDYIGAILFSENSRFDVTKNFLFMYEALYRFLTTIEKYISDDTYEDLKILTIEDVYNDKMNFLISYNDRFMDTIDKIDNFDLIITKFSYVDKYNIIKFVKFCDFHEKCRFFVRFNIDDIECTDDIEDSITVEQIIENNLRIRKNWNPSYYINVSLIHHIFLNKIIDSIGKSALNIMVQDYISDLQS